jgi:hypothetical protein
MRCRAANEQNVDLGASHANHRKEIGLFSPSSQTAFAHGSPPAAVRGARGGPSRKGDPDPDVTVESARLPTVVLGRAPTPALGGLRREAEEASPALAGAAPGGGSGSAPKTTDQIQAVVLTAATGKMSIKVGRAVAEADLLPGTQAKAAVVEGRVKAADESRRKARRCGRIAASSPTSFGSIELRRTPHSGSGNSRSTRSSFTSTIAASPSSGSPSSSRRHSPFCRC